MRACLAITSDTHSSHGSIIQSEKATEILKDNSSMQMVHDVVQDVTVAAENATVTIAENPSEVRVSLEAKEGREKEEGNGQEWITPNKHVRSPGKTNNELKFGEVSILSNSYSALCGKDEGDEVEKLDNDSIDTSIAEARTMQEDIADEINTNRVKQGRGYKTNMPPRPSLPRGSKSSHKVLSNSISQSARDLSKVSGQRPSHPSV